MSKKKPFRIKKNDFSRVLITETIPYETPIIFSNDGFRKHVDAEFSVGSVRQFLVRKLIKDPAGEDNHSTIPFLYKVRKDSFGFRRLALVHPASQLKMQSFYQQYDQLIIHYCTQSPASIRAPQRVASTYYAKNSWENIYQYKKGNVSTVSIDKWAKHSPSYFSYSGVDRLYKFFDSPDYLDLEKKFEFMWSLDVSKCFDSIYTHTLSWAIKDKHFTKQHKAVKSTFAQLFDSLIASANHSETNGIVIGPEISRIFAEIIFQAIDLRVIDRLMKTKELIFGTDYCFRRYVDDVFIFAKTESDASIIYDCYCDNLMEFNLHANALKSIRLNRPFVTQKSIIVNEMATVANDFFSKFLDDTDGQRLVPKGVRNCWRLSLSFIDSIKSVCGRHQVAYDEVSSYLISVLSERIKKLVNVHSLQEIETPRHAYRDAILVLVEVMYFLYNVAPSVSASYKLSTSITVVMRFLQKYLVEDVNTIYQRIYELTKNFLVQQSERKVPPIETLVSLEAINLILVLRDIGDEYLLPERIVEPLFFTGGSASYFQAVTCLYYIQKHNKYDCLRRKMKSWIADKLKHLSNIKSDSEKAHLLLDVLSCPYVDESDKRKWLSDLYMSFDWPAPAEVEIFSFLADSQSWTWFIDWSELDLLNSLEKKELKRAY
jgi:hypothetical protein